MFRTISYLLCYIYYINTTLNQTTTEEEKAHTEKTLLNFKNLQKSTNETDWISISEMQIKTPLGSESKLKRKIFRMVRRWRMVS